MRTRPDQARPQHPCLARASALQIPAQPSPPAAHPMPDPTPEPTTSPALPNTSASHGPQPTLSVALHLPITSAPQLLHLPPITCPAHHISPPATTSAAHHLPCPSHQPPSLLRLPPITCPALHHSQPWPPTTPSAADYTTFLGTSASAHCGLSICRQPIATLPHLTIPTTHASQHTSQIHSATITVHLLSTSSACPHPATSRTTAIALCPLLPRSRLRLIPSLSGGKE